MKTGFQQFQNNVQRQQQHRRDQAGFYYLKKKRERAAQIEPASLSVPVSPGYYEALAAPGTDYRGEGPVVWLFKLPFRIVLFFIKAVIALAAFGLLIFVVLAVLSALLG